MNCKETEKQILLFPELTSGEQARVIDHLKSCPTCTVLFDSVSKTNHVLHKIAKVNIELEDPFRLTNSIMARIRTEKRQTWTLFDLSFLKFEFTYAKYAMAVTSFFLVLFFGMEQFQSPAILGGISKSQSKKVVLNRKAFQDELGKSKAAAHLILANSCKSPFHITKVNEECMKQRMAF